MKRIFAAFVLLSVLAVTIEAQDLNGFANDFEALMVGVTRDAAPNLQMSALSGNIIGDADLDRLTFFFPSIGITVTDGFASILEPDAYGWEFLLEMPAIINTIVGDDLKMKENINALESRFFPLMSMKMGFGIPLPSDMDLIVTGMFIPPAVTEALLKQAGDDIASQGIGFSTLNFGVEVRKALLKDGKGSPALSLGGLYNFGAFNLEVSDLSLLKLTGGSGVDVGGQNLDLNGSMEYKTSIHNIGFDLHVSKHLLFFTPYAKLSGIYQYAKASTDTDMLATLSTTTGTVINEITIKTSPVVVISNFSTLATLGYELKLLAFVFNTNAMFDLARFNLDISDFSLTGITGRGFSLNMGVRWQF